MIAFIYNIIWGKHQTYVIYILMLLLYDMKQSYKLIFSPLTLTLTKENSKNIIYYIIQNQQINIISRLK